MKAHYLENDHLKLPMFTVILFRNCKKCDRSGIRELMHFQLASCRGGT